MNKAKANSWVEGWWIPAGLGLLAIVGIGISVWVWYFDLRHLPVPPPLSALIGGLLTYVATLIIGLITWIYVRTTERTLQLTVDQLSAKPAIDVTFDGSDYDYVNDTFPTPNGDVEVRLRLRVTLVNNGKAAGFVALREPRLLSSATMIQSYFDGDQKTPVGSLKVEVNEIKPAIAVVRYRSWRGIELESLKFVAGDLTFESLDRGKFQVRFEAGTKTVLL